MYLAWRGPVGYYLDQPGLLCPGSQALAGYGGMPMEVGECIRSRRTVRTFKPDPVPERVITRVLNAGRLAPSSRHQQPWHFIVLQDRATLQKIGGIATTGPFIAQAPLAIAVVMDQNADRPELDAGRALQQMELMAWAEGLGTCFVGLRDPEQNRRVKELLGIPAAMTLVTVMPLGYRPEGFKGAGRGRKPLAEVAHREKFGQPYGAG